MNAMQCLVALQTSICSGFSEKVKRGSFPGGHTMMLENLRVAEQVFVKCKVFDADRRPLASPGNEGCEEFKRSRLRITSLVSTRSSV